MKMPKSEELKPQVSKENYFEGYDNKKRWISYWHQINEIINLATKKDNILNIGPGNGTVTDYLRKIGFNVATLDIDPDLKPDYVGSVTELTEMFEPKSFDVILCAEVLEHIPFEYFERCITGIHSVCRKGAVISLPNNTMLFYLTLRLPIIREKTIKFGIPIFFMKHKFDGQHYWEIGKRGYSLGKISSVIDKYFRIEKNYYLLEHPFHRFFVLKKV